MIIEADDQVLILDKEPGRIIKAMPATFIDEWIILTEDEYGDVFVETLKEAEMIDIYGEIPTD